ncbi:MAG TPA: hypothetical protein VJP79_02065 [Nitrososphaera sp.]|nr:hypothetical protein [Nitrososphaera sp.]
MLRIAAAAALTTSVLAFMLIATTATITTTNAFAMQFSFDPSSGKAIDQPGFAVPGSIIAIVSGIGALVIVLERRRAKGIWFSNSERLR